MLLRIVCGVDESKLRIYLYHHTNQNSRDLIKFWSRLTAVPERQFTQPYVRESIRSVENKMTHGVVHVRYNDKKLLLQILLWIEQYKKIASVVP